MVYLGSSMGSYNAFSCGDWLLRSISLSDFLLMQIKYVIINVMITVAVSVRMKVKNVIVTTAPVDNELESDTE